MKRALVLGATGLVGSSLSRMLLDNPDYELVRVFTRRSLGFKHDRLREHLVDFENPDAWSEKIIGDIAFLCLGTTLKKAGSKQAQFRVDYEYQLEFAKRAVNNGVKSLILVSSAGASASSPFFYMKMKADLESALKQLPFKQLVLIRPGALMGKRSEKRAGELAGVRILRFLNSLGMFLRYKPIQAEQVAAAMLAAAGKSEEGIKIYELDDLFGMSESYKTAR